MRKEILPTRLPTPRQEPEFFPAARRKAETLLDYGRRLHRTEMQRLKMRHRAGLGGHEVVRHRSRLMDFLIEQLWSEGSPEGGLPGLVVVAIGGYGRAELAPFSDVDLMFLIKSRTPERTALIQSMLCLLWDMGLQVGHSVRSIRECAQMATTDLVSMNSMLDARHLQGDKELFDQFREKLARTVARSRKALEEKVFRSIEERHAGQGGTAFIQEPDVKEAKGGLRDFHTIGWIVKSFFPGKSPEEVLQKHAVALSEWKRTQNAYEFLLRLRNELHFLSGRRMDVLSHSVLPAVVKDFGSPQSGSHKDDEAFLRHYYLQVRHVTQVLEVLTMPLRRSASPKSKWLSSKLVRLVPANPRGAEAKRALAVVPADPEQWMSMFRYEPAGQSAFQKAASNPLRQNLSRFSQASFATPSIGSSFRAILRRKGEVAPAIRRMHELGFLGRVLPEFGRLTCMVQHDLYHKYTADEHTLRALDVLDSIAAEKQPRHAPYRKILNEIHDSSSLYFAMLMHDIGKGLGGGHSARGAALVAKALDRLGFDPDEAQKIQTLVRHHLLMGHVSQRRNLDDTHTIEEFVRVIDRLDLLNMLLLLTYADAQAVAPGVWTDWKDHMLWELYHRAYDRLMFAESVSAASHADATQVRKQVFEAVKGEMSPETLESHFKHLPESYLLYTPVSQIVEQLRLSRKLEGAEVVFEWVDHLEQGYSDLILVTRDRPGLFAQIAGGLSTFNLNILSAQLNTRADGIVFDVFQVGNLSGSHRLQHEDLPRVEKLLKKVIAGQVDLQEYRKAHFKPQRAASGAHVSFQPRVRIDNGVSPTATVIEVQASDRIGLGYQIARTLAGFNLNIVFAKLATEKSHAFDVFYVRKANGEKLADLAQIQEIEDRLRADVMDF